MTEAHLAYLNLGSNIQPEINLPRAVELLAQHGDILKISSVWESQAVGTEGPNYLNACLAFRSAFTQAGLKEQVINFIETRLGRQRTADKYAPRTMDIDIILFDDQWVSESGWELAYVLIPLAEIYPAYHHPSTHETVSDRAARLRQEVWLETRRGILG